MTVYVDDMRAPYRGMKMYHAVGIWAGVQKRLVVNG